MPSLLGSMWRRYHTALPTKFKGGDEPFCASYDHGQAQRVLGLYFKAPSESVVEMARDMCVWAHGLPLIFVFDLDADIAAHFLLTFQCRISRDLVKPPASEL